MELKETTFSVSTGHTLLAVTGEVMQDLFQAPAPIYFHYYQQQFSYVFIDSSQQDPQAQDIGNTGNGKSPDASSAELDSSSPRPATTRPKPTARPPVKPQNDMRYFLAVKATGSLLLILLIYNNSHMNIRHFLRGRRRTRMGCSGRECKQAIGSHNLRV